MAENNRDEFPKSVVRVVGLRAGYLCSNPDCRRPTSGPHSDPTKAIITGEAAHICAAAEGGPRYKAEQRSEERKSIQNAIWLCGVCSKKVDTDWAAWPEEKLHEMKATHEKWIAAEAMIPERPEIQLGSISPMRLHPSVPEMTAEIQHNLREHELVVRNPNRVELFNFVLAWTLPESVIRDGHADVPTGPVVKVRPVRPQMVAMVRGTGTVKAGPDPLTTEYRLDIDRLPAGAAFRMAFYTVVPEQTMFYQMCKNYPDDFSDPEKMDDHKECHFYLDGSYQFVLRTEYVTNTVFVPLLFKADARTITSYPVQDTREPWKIWRGVLGSGATFGVGKAKP